jgi:glycosyltransferase involved in cell wall biosynthesis
MPLAILQVAYPFAPVGRDSVGGAEQVLAACDEAVVRAGHRSIVVACEGSRTAGTLIAVPRTAQADDPQARAAAHANHQRAIKTAIASFPVDVVHCHGIDFNAYLPAEGVPVLVTLHLSASLYNPMALRPSRAGIYFNCVSHSQHRACPDLPNLLRPIVNGVDIEGLRAEPGARRAHALVLARICPEKGIHLAIQAARAADVDLVIAGEVFPYADHQRYFNQEIQPRLDARRVFIGPAGFETKRRLLQAARCLLVPSLIEETSSLVAMEALACGAPVVAFRRGALAEIVEHGATGFLAENADEMALAIGRADLLKAADCAGAAKQRFDAGRMAGEYLDLYGKLSLGRMRRRHMRRAAS